MEYYSIKYGILLHQIWNNIESMCWNSIVYMCCQPMIATPSDLQNLKTWRLRDYKFEKADKNQTHTTMHMKKVHPFVLHMLRQSKTIKCDERNEKI